MLMSPVICPGVVAALAGTTTRLRTNVRANSKERNFFM